MLAPETALPLLVETGAAIHCQSRSPTIFSLVPSSRTSLHAKLAPGIRSAGPFEHQTSLAPDYVNKVLRRSLNISSTSSIPFITQGFPFNPDSTFHHLSFITFITPSTPFILPPLTPPPPPTIQHTS